MSVRPHPTTDETDEILLSCRYGDLEDVQAFVEKFGVEALWEVKDANANTVVHMISANGHEDVLAYLLDLPSFPKSLLEAPNASRSTPLHWAALNSQLGIAKRIVEIGGAHLIDLKNTAGRSPLGEAESAGWDEGAQFFVSTMDLGKDVEEGQTDEVVDPNQNVEITIEDAQGGIANISLGGESVKKPDA
ncbi:hypothetical protein CYLTODRAFT_402512 [Cylindrobasidium torrendii FP15055 ss-10]|uniref:Uncharacterized protein n=1 Tax=Cylindrobasidium torrendii FP15055 ss-10 TaxID=1314674 RepID=A0A0D7B140_9AGAR|nr:hypothetical protein CYLTODRAFT_402512 [Cylindrobasidium torrendii FP15055 ss-10]